jgi:hypothetical protein
MILSVTGLAEAARVEPEVRARPQHHGRVGSSLLWRKATVHPDEYPVSPLIDIA